MSSIVGIKGQVVIEKEIRDRLKIRPGYHAVQTVSDGQLIVRFVAPDHNRSLRGAAKHLITSKPSPQADWDKTGEQAMAREWMEESTDLENGASR